MCIETRYMRCSLTVLYICAMFFQLQECWHLIFFSLFVHSIEKYHLPSPGSHSIHVFMIMQSIPPHEIFQQMICLSNRMCFEYYIYVSYHFYEIHSSTQALPYSINYTNYPYSLNHTNYIYQNWLHAMWDIYVPNADPVIIRVYPHINSIIP